MTKQNLKPQSNQNNKAQHQMGDLTLVLPLPPLQITALESPTLATNKRSPTRIAVEAVDPASLFWVFSDFRNSESVWLYASAERKENRNIRGEPAELFI